MRTPIFNCSFFEHIPHSENVLAQPSKRSVAASIIPKLLQDINVKIKNQCLLLEIINLRIYQMAEKRQHFPRTFYKSHLSWNGVFIPFNP